MNKTPAEVLADIRLGIEMDAAHLDDAADRLSALDAAIAALSAPQGEAAQPQPEGAPHWANLPEGVDPEDYEDVTPPPQQAEQQPGEVAVTDEMVEAAMPRQPDGYAYRYPDAFGSGRTVIEFSGGKERNGNPPIEAIPYYFGAPPESSEQFGRRPDKSAAITTGGRNG